MQIGQPSNVHGEWMSTAVAASGKFHQHDPIGCLTFGDESYQLLPWRGSRLDPAARNDPAFRPTSWGATTTNIANHPSAGALPGAGHVVRSPGFGTDARPGTEKWASSHVFANRPREHPPLTQRVSSRPAMSLPPLESRAGLYGSSMLVRG